MSITKWAAIALATSMSIAACGGGGSTEIGDSGAAMRSGSLDADSSGGAGDSQSDATGSPSGESGTGFNATVTIAPAEGAFLSDRVRLEIEGAGIENAELLPAAEGRPYALFDISPDKSRAWVEFDTRTVADGTIQVVIDAYNQPAGTDGASASRAMQTRTWTIQNPTVSSPYPGEYPLSRDAAPLQAMIDMSEEEFARMIDNDWPRIHALLQEYIPNNVVFDPPVPRSFEGPRSSCIQNAYAAPTACREYMNRIVALLQ